MKELTVKARLALFSSKKCQKRPKYLLLKNILYLLLPPYFGLAAFDIFVFK